jgi:hypothetical protein
VCGIDNPRGLRLKFQRNGARVFTTLSLPEWSAGFKGTAHGGIVATVLDEAMSWAATCHARGATATGEMTVRFRQPTPIGPALSLEAEVVKARGLLMYVEARLFLDGLLLASSTGKHMKLPASAKGSYRLAYAPGDIRIFDEDDGPLRG